jgi:integrase
MKASIITLANDLHHGNPVVRVSFEKDFLIISQRLQHESSKTTEIYTHVSKKELGKIVNPLDDFG